MPASHRRDWHAAYGVTPVLVETHRPAVNVNTGHIAWRVRLGFVAELEAQGIKHTGSLTLGGSLATAQLAGVHRRHG